MLKNCVVVCRQSKEGEKKKKMGKKHNPAKPWPWNRPPSINLPSRPTSLAVD